MEWRKKLYMLYDNVCVCVQSCPKLCDPMDCSSPDSSVYGIFQVKNWSGFPFPSLGDLANLGIESESIASPALAVRFFTTEPSGKPLYDHMYLYSYVFI